MSTMTIDCDRTTTVLDKIKTAIGNDLSTLSMRIKDDICRISAQSKDISIALDTPAEGSGTFGLYATTLDHMLSGRSALDMELNSKKSQLSFRESGSAKKTNTYQGSIVTLPYIKINVDNPSKDAHFIPYSSGVIQHFDYARKVLAIKNITDSSDIWSEQLSVRVKDGQMICGSYDRAHMGIYSVSVDFENEMSFSIPFDVLKRVMALIDASREDPRFKKTEKEEKTEKEQDMKMAVDMGALYLKAFNMRASLRMVQADVRPFDIAINMLTKSRESVLSDGHGLGIAAIRLP